MKKIIKFEALIELPNGVKKGDFLIEKDGKYVNVETDVVVPYNPVKDSKFFNKIKELPMEFKIGDLVLLKKPENLAVTGKNRGYFTIPAWTPVIVVGSVIKFNKSVPLIDFNGRRYEAYKVELFKVEKYAYINSSGVVHTAFKGRDIPADQFRLKSKNYYNTKEEAGVALKKILAKSLTIEVKHDNSNGISA